MRADDYQTLNGSTATTSDNSFVEALFAEVLQVPFLPWCCSRATPPAARCVNIETQPMKGALMIRRLGILALSLLLTIGVAGAADLTVPSKARYTKPLNPRTVGHPAKQRSVEQPMKKMRSSSSAN
jgi:hypothetical protein